MGDYIGIMILLLLAASSFTGKDEELNAKVKLMDKKLDRIMEHLGIEGPEIEEQSYDEELKEFLNDGKKIKAIKYLRKETGMGLKEAKNYVDELEEKGYSNE